MTKADIEHMDGKALGSYISGLKLELQVIRDDMNEAWALYQDGHDLDRDWYGRAASARRHRAKEIAALLKLHAEMRAKERAEALERNEQAKAAKEERRAALAKISKEGRSVEDAQVQALLGFLKDHHPSVYDEAMPILKVAVMEFKAARKAA